MPEKSQTTTVAGYDAARLQAIAYGALQQLGWTIKYAGDNVLLAYTPRSWNKYDIEITAKTEDNQLTVTSKMIHGEAFDMMGRNKKHVAEFLAAFETVKAKATDLNTSEWNEKIELLKGETIKTAEQEVKQAVEIDKVMNLSKGNLYVTYGIIASNVLVFVLMVIGGVSFFAPTGIDIIRWGGNFGSLTLTGDWWRLITCVFVHIGIIHLAFNMYALYMAGVYLEPMLGKTKYIMAYLCTGVFASLASLWWHKEPVASAGASGAIFGMYGVFLALLSTSLIPKQIRNSLLQSIGVFVVYNLVYGMKSGVDNSAHVGGLLSGLIIGYIYYPGLKAAGKKSMAIVGLITVLTVVAAAVYLQSNKAADEIRNKTKGEIEEYKYKDADKYNDQVSKFAEAEEKALAPLRDTSLTDRELSEKLQRVSLPEWENANEAIEKIKGYNVSDKSKEKADKLQQYISFRKEEIRLIGEFALKQDEETITKLTELRNKIGQIIEELSKL
jgi:rhomboid protease GluP